MSKLIPSTTPLAERIRPKSLNEFRGQDHLVGESGPISKMIQEDYLSSFLLWGPPGSGKTTLARIISEETKSDFFSLNAVSSGVNDVRKILEIASRNRDHFKKTILFIDEIHRFNKAQQDALLSPVESGVIILIGATTENPSFEIIPPLRSRARTYILKTLSKDNLNDILDYALLNDEFLSGLTIGEINRDFLLFVSGGDARVLLNIFEAAVIHEMNSDNINITQSVLENIVQNKNISYDKNAEEHYNIISAFIKSLRGSDPDAALYWLAIMLEGGEDPLFIARRMVVFSSEDVGNASPNALLLAEAAFGAVDKIGMPEARIILAQCATYLASAPKSNASYVGISKAISDVRNKPQAPVPFHLRNAPTDLMKEIGYSDGYKYPHDFENNFVLEDYLPEDLRGTQYYIPTENGTEKSIKERLKKWWGERKKY